MYMHQDGWVNCSGAQFERKSSIPVKCKLNPRAITRVSKMKQVVLKCFPRDLVEVIVNGMNQFRKVDIAKRKDVRASRHGVVTVMEFYKFLATLIWAGKLNAKTEKVVYSNKDARKFVKMERFKVLRGWLGLGDDILNQIWATLFDVGTDLAFDESFFRYKSTTCPYITSIPRKPARMGLLWYLLAGGLQHSNKPIPIFLVPYISSPKVSASEALLRAMQKIKDSDSLLTPDVFSVVMDAAFSSSDLREAMRDLQIYYSTGNVTFLIWKCVP